MHSHSMRHGLREWRPDAQTCRAFAVFRFFPPQPISLFDIDTNGPAIRSRARTSQVPLLSIIPLRSRMQRKIQRAGFGVRAELLH
jgi:hypothetical protein